MAPRLPPPDPHETFELTVTGGRELIAPTAVFMGPVGPEADRAADVILDLRPGVLIVLPDQ